MPLRCSVRVRWSLTPILAPGIVGVHQLLVSTLMLSHTLDMGLPLTFSEQNAAKVLCCHFHNEVRRKRGAVSCSHALILMEPAYAVHCHGEASGQGAGERGFGSKQQVAGGTSGHLRPSMKQPDPLSPANALCRLRDAGPGDPTQPGLTACFILIHSQDK